MEESSEGQIDRLSAVDLIERIGCAGHEELYILNSQRGHRLRERSSIILYSYSLLHFQGFNSVSIEADVVPESLFQVWRSVARAALEREIIFDISSSTKGQQSEGDQSLFRKGHIDS